MKQIILFTLLLINILNASTVTNSNWGKGETLLTFLEKSSLPISLYYELDRQDKLTVSEIIAGTQFSIMKNIDKIEQVLIPLGDEIQIHIYKDVEDNKFKLQIIPIYYTTKQKTIVLSVKSSPYQEILHNSANYLLAQEFIYSYKKSINFKRDIREGDRVVIVYEESARLGKFWGNPKIIASMVETRGKPNYIFLNTDGRYYNHQGKEIESFLLSAPVKYTRISSRFTLKRWHPIKKRYRPHFGIDYAAPRGTRIKSAGNGRVIFAGRKGGYGNVIEILHEEGYKTLYAHMRSFRGGIRRGKYVKKGQTIGYVGSTGVSTGPHLHFGLYKNNRPINPNRMIKITKKRLKGNTKKEFLKLSKIYKDQILKSLQSTK